MANNRYVALNNHLALAKAVTYNGYQNAEESKLLCT